MKRSDRPGWKTMIVALVVTTVAGATLADDEWPQWGGPEADFTIEDVRLAGSWPEAGPPKLWEMPLGDGFAAIVAGGGRLYTMMRVPSDEIAERRDGEGREVVVALAAETGERLWEHTYEAHVEPDDESHDLRYGRGPNSTPLLAGGRLYTLGFTGMLHGLDAATGDVVWAHDLGRRFEVEMPYFGHASSPIRYRDLVIVLAGGAIAFDLESGALRWHNREVESSYASPRRIRAAGRDQILAPLSGEIAGLDPASGKVLWRREHANQYGTILSSPLVLDAGTDRQLVFVSAAWVGSLGLEIGAAGDGRPQGARELWHNPKMQVTYSNAVRVGDWIYASSGVKVDFLTAINFRTGEIAWKERGLTHVNLLHAGGRFILLEEDGRLSLATLTPEGVTVHDTTQLFDSRSWTVPTLVGTRLYVRDQEKIVALELGESAAGPVAGSAGPGDVAPEAR